MTQIFVTLLENKLPNGLKKDTIPIRSIHSAQISLKKLKKLPSNFSRIAKMIYIKPTMMVFKSITGKDFHYLPSNSTHRELG
tara:strand:- start:716 stop:961 length:246 start_codon:yes stop_codon:yes gene_type:complete